MSVLFTLAVAPVYLLIRQPFRRLPLHVDSGFYVSNHTIATGRFRFSKGWNAHYAGCSKLLPEVFYSLVYLLHGRSDGDCPETVGVSGHWCQRNRRADFNVANSKRLKRGFCL